MQSGFKTMNAALTELLKQKIKENDHEQNREEKGVNQQDLNNALNFELKMVDMDQRLKKQDTIIAELRAEIDNIKVMKAVNTNIPSFIPEENTSQPSKNAKQIETPALKGHSNDSNISMSWAKITGKRNKPIVVLKEEQEEYINKKVEEKCRKMLNTKIQGIQILQQKK